MGLFSIDVTANAHTVIKEQKITLLLMYNAKIILTSKRVAFSCTDNGSENLRKWFPIYSKECL